MTFSDGNFTREILNAVYQVEDVTTKRKFATTRRRMANHEIKRGGIEKTWSTQWRGIWVNLKKNTWMSTAQNLFGGKTPKNAGDGMS
jgi:hypothetical protein